MASLAGLRAVGALRKSIISYKSPGIRLISTSKKNRETASVATPLEHAQSKQETAVKKNWVSFGFDHFDETTDRQAMHAVFFVSVTLCIVGGTFIYAYAPDYLGRDWAQREAFLELRRREALGLPHIDPNLIEPSKIELPSDEELGDTEIVI